MNYNHTYKLMLLLYFLISIVPLSACRSREPEIDAMQGVAYYFYAERAHEGSGGKTVTERQHLFVMAKDSGILPKGTVVIISTELADDEIKEALQNYNSGEKVLFYFKRVGESDPVVITPVYMKKTSAAVDLSSNEAEAEVNRYGYKVIQ